jgi:hypothetical protein
MFGGAARAIPLPAASSPMATAKRSVLNALNRSRITFMLFHSIINCGLILLLTQSTFGNVHAGKRMAISPRARSYPSVNEPVWTLRS